MASLPHAIRKDQADGLRKRFIAPLPSLCTVLSAGSREEKSALMQKLMQNMAQRGRKVLVLDAQTGVPPAGGSSFTAPVRQASERRLLQATHAGAPQVMQVALGDASDEHAVSSALRALASGALMWLVDAELDAEGQLPLSVLAEGELVLQVDADPASIREAYGIMRSLKSLALPGTLSLLVTGASAAHARQVQANLFHAASRYLAMPVRTIVPPAAHHV